MKTPALILVAALVAGWSGSAKADDKELAQAIEGAAQDLADNQWRKAERELKEARADLAATRDDELRARHGFYAALVNHQRSDDAKLSKEERARARTAAIAGYEEYLRTHPDSGGALNNCAQLYAQESGTQAMALRFYDRAIAANDARADAYQLNRAKLLNEMGQGDAALKSSLDIARKDRRNSAAQELSLTLLEGRGNPTEIAEYVRGLNEAGLVIRAIDTAVQQIERLPGKRELVLIALVDSLANPTLTELPETFARSDTAKTLAKHAQDPDIGAGVGELLKLYRNPEQPRSLSWWRNDFNESGREHGWFRGESFLTLARSLGDRCRRAGKQHYECAESYYKFALEFASPMAEPNAFVALAQMYGSSGRQADLASIAKKYEPQLFSGKGMAISRQDKQKEFQFHLALGTMYAHLGKWQDPQWSPAGAIYQLEHAQRAAQSYNGAHPGDKRLQFPSQATELLSDGYTKVGDVKKAAAVRVTGAEEALAAGDDVGAKELMSGQWRAALPANTDPALRNRIRAVDARVAVDR
jgi:hypothetical protein